MRIIRVDTEAVRFVYSTDWHLTDQPPGRRTKSYREEIMAKVGFQRDVSVDRKAIGLCGGDLFHLPHPRAYGNTFSLLTALETTLRGFYLGNLFGVHGNHDLFAHRIENIPHQPIGTLIASGSFVDLSYEPFIFENEDGSVRVQVDAYPYTSDEMFALDRVLNAAPREPGVNYRVVLMHQYGNPGDAPTMHGTPIIGFNQMANCDYDFALWGHDHSRTKTVTIGNCTHIRLGSLARAAFQEDEIDRPISLALLSFGKDKVGIKEIPVPVRPLEIAFKAADKPVQKVQESKAVVEFIQYMDQTVDDIDTTDPREVAKKLAGDDHAVYAKFLEQCEF